MNYVQDWRQVILKTRVQYLFNQISFLTTYAADDDDDDEDEDDK